MELACIQTLRNKNPDIIIDHDGVKHALHAGYHSRAIKDIREGL